MMSSAVASSVAFITESSASLSLQNTRTILRQRHYRIGPVAVTLMSDLPEVADAFHRYYRSYETSIPATGSFRIEVREKRSWRSLRRYYHIFANGRQQCILKNQRSILPFIEWTMNASVAKFLPDYYQIHAATVSRNGTGMIIAGEPGQGKSTLTAGLLAHGWSYLSDEFALIHRGSHQLNAYPKALCIKAGSFEPVLRLGLPLDMKNVLHKGSKGPVSLIDPLAIRPDIVSGVCPVGMIVFPHYEAGATPTIDPMSRAQAMFELVRLSFNFTKFRDRGLGLLSEIVHRSNCVRLQTGDLATTCELLETYMVANRRGNASFMTNRGHST
ncbi:MAG: hypothetical protein FWC56_01390 [Phycisphaerae bacterium]|nr:hypothetical protein [Phycisphaerae bacterium]